MEKRRINLLPLKKKENESFISFKKRKRIFCQNRESAVISREREREK